LECQAQFPIQKQKEYFGEKLYFIFRYNVRQLRIVTGRALYLEKKSLLIFS